MSLYHDFSLPKLDIVFNSEEDIGEIDEFLREKSKN